SSGIEMGVQKRAKLFQRVSQRLLVGARHGWIRHDPIRNETSEKRSLTCADLLRPSEQEFFGFTDLLLTLGVRLAHSDLIKYTSRTDQVALRRNLGFTFIPMRTSARSTPMRRERNSVSTRSNSI